MEAQEILIIVSISNLIKIIRVLKRSSGVLSQIRKIILGLELGQAMRIKWLSSLKALILPVPEFDSAFSYFPTEPYLLVEPLGRKVEKSFVNTLYDYSKIFNLLYGFVKVTDSNI